MVLESVFVFLNVLILFTGIVTLLFAGRSYARFLEGEFRTILLWVIYAYVLFILFKSLEIIAILNPQVPSLFILADVVFFIAVICALVSVKELHSFSKAFGFRHHTLPSPKPAGKKAKRSVKKKRKSRR